MPAGSLGKDWKKTGGRGGSVMSPGVTGMPQLPAAPPGPPPAPPGFCAVGCCSEPLGLQFPVVNQFAALETC